ncbi:hypothetical protein JZO76_07350 [Enterococcus sp. MJM12]|uniref:Phage protein n=1 Tax=Candidatus Enterococcus myersii TaxID=2815322 RepID=A0ABS3H8N4_9ENTE|nr:hypothetical protein [Enterococcus sp. MJM12]MBO0449354.1 hypothetical protein [Enterococcus sp. MJM12]
MRYDTKVLFIKNSEGSHYDPEPGVWIEDEPTVTATDANVTDLGTNRSVALFGSIKQGAVVIRTQPLFIIPKWDNIEIDGKSYQLTTARQPLERNTLIVEEVVKGG